MGICQLHCADCGERIGWDEEHYIAKNGRRVCAWCAEERVEEEFGELKLRQRAQLLGWSPRCERDYDCEEERYAE